MRRLAGLARAGGAAVSLHALDLPGCRPDVLAHYLKALAIFRLVSEQADADARCLWRDGTFVLVSSLDKPGLERFLAEKYKPTPVVAPWNGGSGFYPKGSDDALQAIRAGASDRFAEYRVVIQASLAMTSGQTESPKDEAKQALVARLRAEWPEAAVRWLDAALALSDERVEYPALLGTGGNDGHFDFTNNFMQRLVELIDPSTGAPTSRSRALLHSSLFASPATGLLSGAAIGQFLPGGAGGANASSGYDGDSLLNPWDFVLALEGAVAFQVAAVRRLDTRGLMQGTRSRGSTRFARCDLC